MLPPMRPARWVAGISLNIDGVDVNEDMYAGIAGNCVDSGAVIVDIGADSLRRRWEIEALNALDASPHPN